jgi:hypothetical protein
VAKPLAAGPGLGVLPVFTGVCENFEVSAAVFRFWVHWGRVWVKEGSLNDANVVIVNDGIRQEAAAHFVHVVFRLFGGDVAEFNFPDFGGVNAFDASESQEVQGLRSILAFGVADAGFEVDGDLGLGHVLNRAEIVIHLEGDARLRGYRVE